MKNFLANNPSGLVIHKTASLTTPVDEELGPGSMSRAPLWLVAGFWASIVIAVAVVVRRLVAIVHPSQAAPPLVHYSVEYNSQAPSPFAH